jgi:hypothetical protein
MPRSAAPPLALALGVAVALAIASCGGDAKLLPGGTARQITANLETVQRLAAEGDCAGAESAALQVSEQIDSLGGVDAKLKQALQRGAARLEEATASCEEASLEATEPGGVQAESEAPAGKGAKQRTKKQRQEEEAEAAQPEGGAAQEPPPQAEGEANGQGEGEEAGGEGGEEEAPPSGGVSPGAPAGEGR